MGALDEAPDVQFETRAQWRAWLESHHGTSTGVWVVYFKKSAQGLSPEYEELILEALCFGWIDSTARRVDDQRTKLYFCPRKKGGVWASSNKARIERLVSEGLMTPAGQSVIDQAKADGSWSSLDEQAHSDGGIALFKDLCNEEPLTEEEINVLLSWQRVL